MKNIFAIFLLLFSFSSYAQMNVYGINIEKRYNTFHESKKMFGGLDDGIDIKLKENSVFSSVSIRDSGNTIYYYVTEKKVMENSSFYFDKVKSYLQKKIGNPIILSDEKGKIISIPSHILWKVEINNQFYFFYLYLLGITSLHIYKSTSEEIIDKHINESVESLWAYNNYNKVKWRK